MKTKFRWGLILSALVFGAVIVSSIGNNTPAARAQEPEGAKVVAWDTDGNNGNNKSFIGTNNNKPLVFKTNKIEQMRILPNGSVGIGTTNPVSNLHVLSSGSDVPPRLESAGTESFGAGWDFYHGATGKGYVGVPGTGAGIGPGELLLFGGANTKTSLWAGANRGITLDTNGNVGIGTAEPDHTLEVKGRFQVVNDSELYSLFANSDRTVSVGALAESTTHHLCYFGTYTLSSCSSAAEYVPSIDGGKGFPETADLVSIAPDVKNPYGDTHGPFVVQKSLQQCDPNLLGYIVKPESGADGVYKNEHYLPLAIYGYFPAKVSMENGPIKRGDPITSSSKPGYGMKATGACKVIGYALEDADYSGTIQVFANFGDNSAAQVAKLQQLNDALVNKLIAIETRLATVEQTNARLASLQETGAAKNTLVVAPELIR